jgi:hypothetical protein
LRVYIIRQVLPTEIKPTPALVADMDGLGGANGTGTRNYGQRVVISAVDQRIVISAVDDIMAMKLAQRTREPSFSIVEAKRAVRTIGVCA